ncbi:MAG TPA: ATP-binding protein [Opitutaceae bacterium]|jgi:two-component system, sporulation sensor kinase E|nr:PAS domain-containing protein [Opitutaceae bacterium]HRE04235.1 ATP-binding protein [Opitutaceae bacterium]
MATKRNTSLDRVLGRLDQLDAINLTNLVQRLARERGLFEDIFNVLQEGVLVIDMEGVIAYANAAAQRLIGLGADDELAGQTLWRMVPGLRPSLGALMEDDAALPIMAREFELTYPEPRVVRLYMVPFKSEAKKGGGRRFAVILTDVTRDRESTEKRIENERTSSVLLLAASVAHELGNPLNSLTIHLQLMDRRIKKLRPAAKDKDAVALAESVAVCQAEVQRLDGIISNFLEAIRPSPPNLVESDLAEILADVLRFQQNELADRGIQVEAETQAQLPIVMADRNQVKQVFFNIIKNAMEAMSPGGRLRIAAAADDDYVTVAFGDNGSGIKQADLVRMFQPYHTTKPGGHGLGLMIVQRILREHGGQVGIESKEGVGTVVTLQFPRKDRRVRMLT